MANHTTPIDVVILQNDITYALVSSHNISEMWLAQQCGYLDYLVQIDSGGAAVALSIFAIQRFRVRHGLSCVNGPFWPVRAGCYSQAALPMPLSNPLYTNTTYLGMLRCFVELWI